MPNPLRALRRGNAEITHHCLELLFSLLLTLGLQVRSERRPTSAHIPAAISMFSRRRQLRRSTMPLQLDSSDYLPFISPKKRETHRVKEYGNPSSPHGIYPSGPSFPIVSTAAELLLSCRYASSARSLLALIPRHRRQVVHARHCGMDALYPAPSCLIFSNRSGES
jgi:hypothetical protein